jgi:hypothetical protein
MRITNRVLDVVCAIFEELSHAGAEASGGRSFSALLRC